jgi:hypothetical protein
VSVCKLREKCLTEIELPNETTEFTLGYAVAPLELRMTYAIEVVRTSVTTGKVLFQTRPLAISGVSNCGRVCVPVKYERVFPEVDGLILIDLIADPAARKARFDRLSLEFKTYSSRVLQDVKDNETFHRFSTEEQRAGVVACLTETEQSFSGLSEVEQTNSQAVSKSLARLKLCAAVIYRRIEENETFWDLVEKFQAQFIKARRFVQAERTKCDPGHMPKLLEFESVVAKVEGWFNITLKENMEALPSDPLPVKPGLLAEHYADFHRQFGRTKRCIRPPKTSVATPTRVPIESPFWEL